MLGGGKMNLTDIINRAAQQQSVRGTQNTEDIKKTVDLGTGRTSRYGYTGSGRPTNEGCNNIDSNEDIINE